MTDASTAAGARHPRVVVMGVSAVGKSTVGRSLAARLGVEFVDADDLHSAEAVAKMASGTPLTDADRAPWLARVGQAIAQSPGGAVVACSALARRYREALRAGAPDLVFVHLDADPDALALRLAARSEHFMPVSLLASQFAVLEPLGPDEPGFTVDALLPVDEIVDRAVRRLTS